MPTYQFRSPIEPDPSPMSFPDDQAAWSEAVQMCGEMLREIAGEMAS
jgi:hypothetical protein